MIATQWKYETMRGVYMKKIMFMLVFTESEMKLKLTLVLIF